MATGEAAYPVPVELLVKHTLADVRLKDLLKGSHSAPISAHSLVSTKLNLIVGLKSSVGYALGLSKEGEAKIVAYITASFREVFSD